MTIDTILSSDRNSPAYMIAYSALMGAMMRAEDPTLIPDEMPVCGQGDKDAMNRSELTRTNHVEKIARRLYADMRTRSLAAIDQIGTNSAREMGAVALWAKICDSIHS